MKVAAMRSTIGRDVLTAYFATAAKIGSWVAVSSLVYRLAGAGAFALLALIRATLGILNYTSLGLAPAMISLAGKASSQEQEGVGAASAADKRLWYAGARSFTWPQRIYANGLFIGFSAAVIGIAVVFAFARWFTELMRVPVGQMGAPDIVFVMGIGTLLRVFSDAPGAAIQASGRISLDNLLQAFAELLWLAMSALHGAGVRSVTDILSFVAFAHAISGFALAIARLLTAAALHDMLVPHWRLFDPSILRQLLLFGGLVTLAQLADYLYAPADYIIINRLIGADAVAVYAPALQIDAALLLLVSALANVMLPRTALAHAAGDLRAIRMYYIRSTLASLAMLALGGGAIYALSPWLFRLWLGNPMDATRAILPLVLVHTIIGGGSAVGRSILLGVGKAKPFAISVLIAGVGNVGLGFVFVKYLHLGLTGIVIGTIIAVVVRCVLWMPWYILTSLDQMTETPPASPGPPMPAFPA